jgi:hypothetical protein
MRALVLALLLVGCLNENEAAQVRATPEERATSCPRVGAKTPASTCAEMGGQCVPVTCTCAMLPGFVSPQWSCQRAP